MTPRLALLEGEALAELKTRARALDAASRSYCPPYALVAWHDGPVGVDIERVVSCDARFAESITTPAERVPRTDREIISLWAGKEALAKALGDAVDYDPRRLESPAGWRNGVSGAWHAAAISVPDGYCGWMCWR
jgi:phosphopantetheinyl transferase